MALEPRLMFDGAAVAESAHAESIDVQGTQIPAAVPTAVRQSDPGGDAARKEVVFVDTSVAGYKALEADIRDGVAIVEIDGSQDGLAQIAAWAASNQGYDALHILSHGAEGTVSLGSATLTDASLSSAVVRMELAGIGGALKAGGDLLLYGCDVGKGIGGQALIDGLAAAVGADVAASNDSTGAMAGGGDWDLEVRAGTIDVPTLSSSRFGGTLALFTRYDYYTSASGYETKTVTQTVGEETLQTVTSANHIVDGSVADETFVGGAAYTTGQETSLTLSLVSGNKFKLFGMSIRDCALAGESGQWFVLSSSKGTITQFHVPVGEWVTVDSTYDPNGYLNGVTSVTLTRVDGGGNTIPFKSIMVDDVKLSNIVPAGPNAAVTGASLSADTGGDTSDWITGTASQTISGTLSANLAAGESVQVSYDGGTTWSDAGTYATGSNSWSTTTTLAGSDTFKARVTAASGSSTAWSHSYTLDATAPSVPSGLTISNDSGSSSSDGVTADQTLTIGGSAEANTTVTVYKDGASIGTCTANGSGVWVYDHTGTTLAEGTYSFTATAADAAGNVSGTSTAKSVTVDVTAPATPAVTAISEDTGTSGTDLITTDQTLVITGTAVANAIVEVYKDNDLLGTCTAGGTGAWSYDYTGTTLALGTHAFTAKAKDAAHNASGTSTAMNVRVVAALAAPSGLSISGDTGALNNDGKTSDTTLVIAGAAPANATVTVYKDGVSVGTATADGEGIWSFDHTGTILADGSYSFTAVSTANGQSSAFSTAKNVVVDTTAPLAPSALAISSDDGSSSADGVTTDRTLVISGQAEANAIVSVYKDNSLLGVCTADGSGAWSYDYTGTALTLGTYSLTATARDAAGNTGSASTAKVVKVTTDATAPAEPTIQVSGGTSTSVPMTGRAEAGSMVKVYSDNVLLGTTTADDAGHWTYNATLAVGTHALKATATDAAGNTSSDPTQVSVTISQNPGTNNNNHNKTGGDADGQGGKGSGGGLAGGVGGNGGGAGTSVITLANLNGNSASNSGLVVLAGVRGENVNSGLTTSTGGLPGGSGGGPGGGTSSVIASIMAPTGGSGFGGGLGGGLGGGATISVSAASFAVPSLTVAQAAAPVATITTAATPRPAPTAAPVVALAPTMSAPVAGGFQVAVVAPQVAGVVAADVVVAKPIGTVDAVGGRVSFSVPPDAFAVTRADTSISLSATRANGQPLPPWMNFNPATGTFEGTPPPGEKVVEVKVVARDRASGKEAAQVFKVNLGGEGQDQPVRGRTGDAQPVGARFAFTGKPGLTKQLAAGRPGNTAHMATLAKALTNVSGKVA